jgi:hypothetical protein
MCLPAESEGQPEPSPNPLPLQSLTLVGLANETSWISADRRDWQHGQRSRS